MSPTVIWMVFFNCFIIFMAALGEITRTFNLNMCLITDQKVDINYGKLNQNFTNSGPKCNKYLISF